MELKTILAMLLIMGAAMAFTNVGACGTLSTNAETYNLSSNLSINAATCLTISASNSVIYCNGKVIVGNNTNQTNGVYVTGNNNQIFGCNSTNFTNAYNIAGNNITLNGVIGTIRMGSGSFGTAFLGAGANILVINSTFYSFPPSYVTVYPASSTNFTMKNSIVYTNGSNGAVYGFNFNQTYINNTIITNQSFGIQTAGGGVVTFIIENNTIQSDGSAVGLSIFANGGRVFNNKFFGSSSTARISASTTNSGLGIYAANNFTCQIGTCVTDANGTNKYNGTYMAQNQGNIWQNIANGTLKVRGILPSASVPNYYLGVTGNGYPYNNSTSLGKFSCNFAGCGDYSPLTTYYGLIDTYQVSPANGFTYYNAPINLTFNCSSPIYGSMEAIVTVDSITRYSGNVLTNTNNTYLYPSSEVGAHTWYVSCSNQSDINTTATRSFTRLAAALNTTLISPANNSNTPTPTQILSWTCNSSDSSTITTSLVFDGATVVNNLPGTNLAQQNYTASLSLGVHSWYATCFAGAAINTSGVRFFTRTGSFNISLLAPSNNTNIYTTTYPFAWNVSGAVSSYLCNITINGTVQSANIPSPNASIMNVSASFPFQNNNKWNITCWDGTTANFSSTRNFSAFARPTCTISLSPFPTMNTSSNVSATPSPAGQYTYYFTTFDNVVVRPLSTENNFTVNSTYTSTRIYVYANSTIDASCSNYTLVFSTKQTTAQNDLFSSTITSFYLGYRDIIIGIFTVGIAFSLTSRIGTTAIATAVMWAIAFLLIGSSTLLYGAIVMLVLGLIATYGRL